MVKLLLPILLLAPLPLQAQEKSLQKWSPAELQQQLRNWESEKNRTDPKDVLNNALVDLDWDDYGSDDPTEPEELLQLPSDFDRQSAGWRHDRCNHRSWFRPFQKREGKDCRC